MTKQRPITQSGAFVANMVQTGWIRLNNWYEGGHLFELLSKNGKTLLVQTYPEGHGFQIWKPLTESNTLTETRIAVEEYGQ